MVPPEEMSAIPTEEADPQSTMTPASTPEEPATMRVVREPAVERKPPKFLGWEKGIAPILTCGGCWADTPSIERSKSKIL